MAFSFFQLRMRTGKQNRIHHFRKPDGREIPGEPHNQLGRDSVGEPPPGDVDSAGYPGND